MVTRDRGASRYDRAGVSGKARLPVAGRGATEASLSTTAMWLATFASSRKGDRAPRHSVILSIESPWIVYAGRRKDLTCPRHWAV